ncbi:hypothetical protein [Allomuricauda sp. M10]|uniref:hypothetical protein n=1 Tax=Allomuricauda sp. M10 TaxID=2683292 RepID=UPI001D187B1C|nr:hypothetical protein [Muricauda sp. M10]
MSKTENYLSEVKQKKLFDEQYKDATMEELAKASLYLQQQQAATQSKMQKDFRVMLIIGIVIIALNVVGYVILLLWETLFGTSYY